VRKLARTILAVFLIILPFWCSGQQYNFRSYSLEEGLPQSEVRSLIQDNKGNLWLGTNGGGLCRFNGKDFEVYTKKQGLPDNLVGAVYEDSKGILWIATSKGISSYDGLEFTHYSDDKGVQDGQYFWIKEDKNGDIWVLGLENTGNRAILRLEGDHFEDFSKNHPELSEDNFIFWVFQDKQQNFQIITREGLYQYDGSRLESSPLEDLMPEGQVIFPFLQDSKDNLWVAAGEFPNINDLYLLKDGKLTPMDLPDGIVPSRINFALEDSQGQVWLSVFGIGIIKYTPNNQGIGTFQQFTRANGLPINFINNILEDREGNIWFGSNGGGLIKYSSDKFVALNLEDGLSSEIIRAVAQDSNGNYWFGTAGGAIIKFDGTTVENVLLEEDSKIGFVRKFMSLENGNLLIASFTGLWEYDGKDFNKVNKKFGIPENGLVGDIIKDGNEYLISIFGQGVARYDGRETTFITTANDSIATDNITHLMKDSQGNIWMASNLMGVTKYQANPLDPLEPANTSNDSRVENFNSKNGLNNDYILQVAEDRTGKLWMASYGGGLNIFDGKEFTYLDTEQGLTSDNIYSVIADDDGNIWAGTQNGVDKITLDEEGQVISIINYDKYDGFTGIEANGMANFKDDEGNLWFGTIKGVMRYKPTADQTNPTPPVTSITKLRLFFKDVDWDNETYNEYLENVGAWHRLPVNLTLPHDLNHLSFEFEALSFQVPEKVKYQWKLNGLDKDWSPVSSKTEAVYPNLPPGDYTFMVKASNNDGIWNEAPAAFTFSVKAPWWGTLWFRVLATMMIFAMAYLFYKLRVRSIKEKKKELEQQVQLKTQEVVRQKDEILVQSQKLERSNENLELLSEVGKSITSNLSISKLIDTVYQNVNSLMDANVFWIGILDQEHQRLEFTGAVENGEVLDTFYFDLEDENRPAVWCLKNGKEIFINNYPEEYHKYTEERVGSLVGRPTLSIIYVPLISQGQPIGVLSVQSYEAEAYDEHHLGLIRNIAVHTEIALENASAYEKISQQSKGLRRQKAQIETKNQELLELNKEKNHLIGIVAHDLRNPLTSALTIGGILKSEELSSEQLEYTDHMLNAMERMNTMVNRILDIKAIESKRLDLQLEPINLLEVLHEVKSDFGDTLMEKDILFSVEQAETEAKANLDRNYLTQIVENLVSNAIKFSPRDTTIKAHVCIKADQVMLAIQDQGPGISDEDRPLLFQKYQTLSARPTAGEQSTGLGLSIVKKYVEAMNGSVWCESEAGNGATFFIKFNRID